MKTRKSCWHTCSHWLNRIPKCCGVFGEVLVLFFQRDDIDSSVHQKPSSDKVPSLEYCGIIINSVQLGKHKIVIIEFVYFLMWVLEIYFSYVNNILIKLMMTPYEKIYRSIRRRQFFYSFMRCYAVVQDYCRHLLYKNSHVVK